jgi:uncharacterized protein YcbK (DUF882 family)
MPGLSDMKSFPCCMAAMARGGALAGDGRAGDQLDLVGLQDLALAARAAGVRVLLGERLGQIRLLGEEGHQLAAAAGDRIDLPVDVRMVDSDHAEVDARVLREGGTRGILRLLGRHFGNSLERRHCTQSPLSCRGLTRKPRWADSNLAVARLTVTLLAITMAARARVAAAQPGEEAENPPEPAAAESAEAPKPAAKTVPRSTPLGKIPRMQGHMVPDVKLRKRLPPPPSGNIHLHNVYRQESLKLNIFERDGSYNLEALRALSRLLRCKRTDTATTIEPRLFVILSHVYDHFGERRIEVTSGYRNQVRTTSNHFRGSATDIHLQGVSPRELSAFIESLDSGGMGVGLYPRGGFVHVDVRPPPSYRWIDYSPTDPDDPARRPPPGWKLRKKRLQS